MRKEDPDKMKNGGQDQFKGPYKCNKYGSNFMTYVFVTPIKRKKWNTSKLYMEEMLDKEGGREDRGSHVCNMLWGSEFGVVK